MQSQGKDAPVLVARNLSKTFPGMRALDQVSLELLPGEVHALVGQNGSGKSTLIKILAGYHRPDRGSEVMVGGRSLAFEDPKASVEAGLRFVHQDLALVPALDTLDNLALGRGYLRSGIGTISWRREATAARELLDDLGFEFDPNTPVGHLRASERTGVAIARALQGWEKGAKVLVLDEPTAALPAAEVRRLFDVVEMIRARGVAVIYISHHFQEVFEVCQRVTVLRDGKMVGTREVATLDEPALIELTIGRSLESVDVRPVSRVGEEVALRVCGLAGRTVGAIDLTVHRGEVVGVAGVTGSGREEIASLVFGASRRGGEVEVGGQVLPPGRPDLAIGSGLAFVPSERLSQGLLPEMSVKENLTITTLRPYMNALTLNKRSERRDASAWLERLEVAPRRPDMPISRLSGGNQQKVMLGRALRLKPQVLILDEPTQGVDVGAKDTIHGIIDGVAAEGGAVLVMSTDTEELVRLCDRIIVLARGAVRAVCQSSSVTADQLTELTHSSNVVGS